MHLALRVDNLPERPRGRIVVEGVPTALVVTQFLHVREGSVDVAFGHLGI